MKKIFIIILIFLFLFGVTIFGKNIIARAIVSAGLRTMTGLKLHIERMGVNVLNSLINIEGLKLFNPQGFKDRCMLEAPEIYIVYDLGAFLRGKVHLEKLRLNLKEFVVVKNEKGEFNIDSLKVIKRKRDKLGKRKKEKKVVIQIDTLELKIGKVIYKDYTRRTKPDIKEYNININERFENITDPYKLAELIVFNALVNTSIDRIINFDLSILKDGLGGAIGITTKTVEKTTEKVKGAIREILPIGE